MSSAVSPRRRFLIAYMDAPCFASHMARDGEVGEIATVHSDFDVLDGTVPDGYWRAGSLAR